MTESLTYNGGGKAAIVKKAAFIMMIVLTVILSACSSSQSESSSTPSEADVKIDFTTNPAKVHTGSTVTLQSVVTGLSTLDDATFAFDIRKSDWKKLPELIDAKLDDKTGAFIADTTFAEPGSYYVYLHLYQGELHITKKKELVVE
ncbi:hypothetical protein [Paenibacillus xylaniclasticus]|uniref:hypothetical protein n=1 Tax=Paenibacillus xylaniclasticus TaxID=588083 RepID=UPI000FD7C5D3|nr:MULTISPECIES: hypothetical protein [Paenibacillus]GFN31609.1 hypothetical protein PCURB6_18690 [Paenibacillus curdlanolyticus]